MSLGQALHAVPDHLPMKKGVMTTTACEHFWKVEPAHGPTSEGRCEVCHTVKTFSNLEQTDRRPSWIQVKKKAKAKVQL